MRTPENDIELLILTLEDCNEVMQTSIDKCNLAKQMTPPQNWDRSETTSGPAMRIEKNVKLVAELRKKHNLTPWPRS